MLDPTSSRARQRRLLEVMQRRRLNAVVVALPHHVYYLSAVLPRLRGGLRIENEYLVTKTGVRNLLDTPTELM